MALSRYIVIDTETTGLGNSDRIIEVAAARVTNGEITDTFSRLINPEMPLPYHISRLTGIYSPMLRDASIAADVLPDLLAFIGDLPLVGHNIAFDLRMLHNELERLNLTLPTNEVYDTLELARERCPHWPRYKLSDLCRSFHVSNNDAHRALSDVIATQQCFEKLLRTPIGSVDFAPETCVRYVPVGLPNLQGLSFCITGDPSCMSKQDAFALIEARDGIVKSGVSSKLDVLVNCFAGSDYQSGKLKEALQLIDKGKQLHIVTEEEFLRMLGIFREDDEAGIAEAIANPPPQADGDSFPCTPDDIEQLYREKIFDPAYDGYQEGGFSSKLSSTKRLIYSFYGDKAFEFKPGTRGKSRLYLPSTIMQVLFPDNDYPDTKYYPVISLTDSQMEKLIELLRIRKYDAFRALGETFACCNSYVECSDQRGCIHKTECFYNACEYRRNLEAGQIFYGKNRNA